MNKKKVVTLDEGEDPLSTGSNSFAKKPAAKNVFERVIQEQEKDLLHGPNDKKTGFVVNKNTQVHISSKDVPSGQGNTASTNPFNKQPARLPQQPMQPREVVFPNQPKREGERKKTPSPPHRPFENPKVKELARAPEERHQVSPPKPSSGHPAPQREAVRLINVDLVPGEKPIASVTCSIYLLQYPHLSTEGTLVMTNYQIIFRPSDESFYNRKPKLKKDYLQMPLTFINKLEKTGDKRAGDLVQLDIHSKDGRSFRIRISEKYASDIMQYLNVYAFPERKDHFFAIEYGKANRELEDRFKGWKIYDIEKEFLRQGCDFEPTGQQAKSGSNRRFRILENKDFRICSTYPPKLLIPAKISDSAFFASSRFRTKERVPCVTYYYAKTKAILARSSQSKPGLYQSRCLEDEQLLRYLGNPDLNDIGDTGVTDVNLYIYDARPYLNAMANRVNGKGFEDTKWYRNCEIFFMDIDNIHHVRDGHRKMLNLCYNPDTSNIKWYSQLESSNWLEFISFIMGASIKITSSLRNGKNCLVHCSDGWDRTAQILSLAQIMLDPYFRTIEGFEVLIMKDWVYFGHQFNMRMGHGNRNEKDDQRSPVFLQFLDCIHQLICQYPFAFEFNQKFLADLAYHAYSCKFGLFLCNSFKEIMEHKLEERTISVWSYMNAQKDKYYNLYYNGPGDSNNPLILKPSHHLKHLKIWEEYFLSYSWLSKPNYELSESIQFSTDFYEYILKKDRKKIRELKAEVEDLRAKLKHYQAKEKSERKDSESPEADALEEEKIDMTPSQKKIKKKKEVPELTHSETIKTTIEDDEGERSPKDLADLEVENRISEISEPEKMKSENLLETGGGESGEGSEAIKSEVDENKISEEKEVKKEESEVEAANKESEKREENGKVEEKGEVGAKTSEEKEVKKEETEVTDKEGTEEKGKVDEKATESADLKKEEIQIENKEEKREEKAEINDTKNIKGQDVKNEEKPVEIQKEEEKKESLNKHEEEGSKKVEESEVETVEKAEEKALDEAEKKETLAVESAAEKNELIQNEEKGESAFEQNLEQKDEKEKEVIVTQNEERTETNII